MDLYIKALVFTSVFNLFAIWRLASHRLRRDLPMLLVFLVFQFAQTAALTISTRDPKSSGYQTIYEVTEPLNWILYILIVREMYNLVFASYPGISSVARWATYASAAVSVLLCIFLSFYSPLREGGHPQFFGYIAYWERCVAFFLGVFIVLMVFLLARYPLKVEFNVVSSIVIFTVYFAGVFVLMMIGSMQTDFALKLRTYGLFALSCVCYAAWGLMVRRPSEAGSHVRKPIDSYEEKRLLDQLGFIDDMLVKSARH